MSVEAKDQPLKAALESTDLETRLAAIAGVARDQNDRLSAAALGALVECLGAEQKSVQRRAADALAAIADRDPRVVPALSAALERQAPRLQWGAAYTLGTVGGALDLRAQKILLEALASPDPDVRWAAANLIVRAGEENRDQLVRGLIELEAHDDHNARKMAIYCLRDLNRSDAAVRAMAERASRSVEAGVRLAALSLLAHSPNTDDRALQILTRCLESDPDAGVRRAAASALGRLGRHSPAATRALERVATQSEDRSLSKAARQSLARLEQSEKADKWR